MKVMIDNKSYFINKYTFETQLISTDALESDKTCNQVEIFSSGDLPQLFTFHGVKFLYTRTGIIIPSINSIFRYIRGSYEKEEILIFYHDSEIYVKYRGKAIKLDDMPSFSDFFCTNIGGIPEWFNHLLDDNNFYKVRLAENKCELSIKGIIHIYRTADNLIYAWLFGRMYDMNSLDERCGNTDDFLYPSRKASIEIDFENMVIYLKYLSKFNIQNRMPLIYKESYLCHDSGISCNEQDFLKRFILM